MQVEFTLNGKAMKTDVDPRTLLVEFLRDQQSLTGTHVGCETSQCGACNVLLDGVPVKSCSLLMVQLDGCDVVSVEGLAQGETLHPMQQAFHENHGLQCGFCTPGMVMAGIGIYQRHGGNVSEQTVRDELEGNLCRCTGYQNIVQSVLAGAKAMAAAEKGA